jgi:hypothetical protein
MKRLTLLLTVLFVFVCGLAMAVDINPSAVDLDNAKVFRAGPDRVYVTDVMYGDGSYSLLLVYDKRNAALIYKPVGKEDQIIPTSIDFGSSYISLTPTGMIEIGGILYGKKIYSGFLKYSGKGLLELQSFKARKIVIGKGKSIQEGIVRIEGHTIDFSKVDLSDAQFAVAGPDLLYLYGIKYGKMDVSGLLRYPGGTKLVLTSFYTDDIFPSSFNLEDVKLVLIDKKTLKVSGVEAYGKRYYGYLEYDGSTHLAYKPVAKAATVAVAVSTETTAEAETTTGAAAASEDKEPAGMDVSVLIAEIKELRTETSLMYDLAIDLAETVIWARAGLGKRTGFIVEGIKVAEHRYDRLSADLKSNRKSLSQKVEDLEDARIDLSIAIDFLRDDMVSMRESFKPEAIVVTSAKPAEKPMAETDMKQDSAGELVGIVNYYAGTSAEFNTQITVDGEVLPLALSSPDAYVNKTVKLSIRYTGVGKRFDIKKIEIVE